MTKMNKTRAQAKPKGPAPAHRTSKATAVEGSKRLSVRDAKYLEGRAAGKSKRRAALDAGFSEKTAENASSRIEPRLQDQLAGLMPTIETIAERINEGVDAVVTETYSHVLGSKLKGTEEIQLKHVDKVAWTERRKYVEMALMLRGLMPGKRVEVGGDPANPAPVRVEFVHVAGLDEP